MRVGVTGHQALPKEVGTYVTEIVGDRFAGLTDLVVVSSLAAGADQLVADLALGLGGALEVVLPCQGYDETLDGPTRAGFLRLLARAGRVETLAFPGPGEEAYMAAGRGVVDRCQELVAVWDGLPARGLGGTADVVAYATTRHVPVAVVWPPGVTRPPEAQSSS